jgi:hypothetical protein
MDNLLSFQDNLYYSPDNVKFYNSSEDDIFKAAREQFGNKLDSILRGDYSSSDDSSSE